MTGVLGFGKIRLIFTHGANSHSVPRGRLHPTSYIRLQDNLESYA